MARGYFRTPDDICLYCGYSDGEKMPYKYGKGSNITYLCKRCAEKAKQYRDDIVNNKSRTHSSGCKEGHHD